MFLKWIDKDGTLLLENVKFIDITSNDYILNINGNLINPIINAC